MSRTCIVVATRHHWKCMQLEKMSKKVYMVFVWFRDILCMNNHWQYKEIMTRIEISNVENKCKLFTEMS